MTKNGCEEGAPVPLPEWPSLCFDDRQIFGFDNGMFDPGQAPDGPDSLWKLSRNNGTTWFAAENITHITRDTTPALTRRVMQQVTN